MDFEQFRQLLRRIETSNVASLDQLVGCSEQEVSALESRYGLRLPQSYALYLRVMGHQSGRLFTCDHMAVFYQDVLDLTADRRETLAECRAEGDNSIPPDFDLPQDALIIASRLGEQFQFIRCQGQEDSPVWYFNNWEYRIGEPHSSVFLWLEAWCQEAEQAIAQGYFNDYPDGTTP